MALPLALAFGIASGAGPLAGLYGAITAGFFASLFGGTPAQISGPTGPMTVVMATVIAAHSQDPATAFTVVMIAGAFQVFLGFLGIGQYMLLMPMPVVSGFMTGVGCIIIVLQAAPLLGHEAMSSATATIAAMSGMLESPNWAALAIGAVTFGVIVLEPPRLRRFIPPPLFGLVVGTLAGLLFSGDVPTIGPLPSGFPSLVVPTVDLAEVTQMVGSAFALAVLGMIDSLLTSLVSDTVTRTNHLPDRELVGQGIGNIVAGLVGGIPGAGATMRTVVNVRAGGRTPISGMVHAVVILVVALWLGPYASRIPLAVLGGILIKVGLDVIDWGYLRRVPRAPKDGVVLMAVVLVLTVLVDLIVAVTVGMVLASLLLVKSMADLQLSSLTAVVGAGQGPRWSDEEASLLERAGGRIVLFEFRGPFSFGAARGVAARLMQAQSHAVLILDLSDVPLIDSSAALALEESVRLASREERHALLVGAHPAVRRVLDQLDVLAQFPPGCVHETRLSALRHAEALLQLSPTAAPWSGE